MTESKSQQGKKKEEKEWSKEEFFQEIIKRKESLEKAMKHYKPVRMWKYMALTMLPYVVYLSAYVFICAKGIEVSSLFYFGGMAIALSPRSACLRNVVAYHMPYRDRLF